MQTRKILSGASLVICISGTFVALASPGVLGSFMILGGFLGFAASRMIKEVS